jgi:fatty acid desaturase
MVFYGETWKLGESLIKGIILVACLFSLICFLALSLYLIDSTWSPHSLAWLWLSHSLLALAL